MPPEVSVVIPTRNRGAMVREAVESVLAQREAGYELIVVDDGSIDGTAGELARLAEETNRSRAAQAIRVTQTPVARGPAAARNLGVALAAAPLLAFLDSDDLWSPDKLRKQIAFMRQHPGYAISQTGELWIRDGVRVNPGRRHLKRAGDIFVDSLRTCLVSPSAAMIKTDLFRTLGGFDEDMAAAEDYDLWLRVLVDHGVGLLQEPLVTRRAGHPGQLSATTAALDRFRILALVKLLQCARLSTERRAAASDVLVEKCAIYAAGLRRRHRAGEARFYESLAHEGGPRWRLGPDGAAGIIDAMRAMLREAAAGWPPAARADAR